MKEKFFEIIAIIASIGTGIFTRLYGNDPSVIKYVVALFIFIGFDILTGIIKSCYKGKFNSTKWTRGISKKVGILVLVSVGFFIDKFDVINFMKAEAAISCFYILGELVSILENLSCCGVKLPEFLKKFLDENKCHY